MTDHVFAADEGGAHCSFRIGSPVGMGTSLCGRYRSEHERKGIKVNLPPEPSDGEAVIVLTAYFEAVRDLVRRKDKAYGGAWQKQGYMGNLARIMSKTERLKNMMWREVTDEEWGTGTAFDETVLDTLRDLMALAAFCAANIEDGNRWGN